MEQISGEKVIMQEIAKDHRALIIQSTLKTPEVIFDPSNGIFTISGKCLPENSDAFFDPVSDWIDEYVKCPNKSTKLVLKLFYMNTSSSKAIYRLIMKFRDMGESDYRFVVCWMYDDEDMEECGRDFEKVTKMGFDFNAFGDFME